MTLTRWLAAVAAAAVIAAPPVAMAQGQGNSCNVSVTGVNFGNYNVFSGTAVQSTGDVSVRCGPGAGADAVRVSLDTGVSGTFHPRTLVLNAQALGYNLYRDAGRSQIWGDGSSGTFDVSMTPEKNTWISLTIYGEVPALQDVAAGTYTDIITATINF